MIGQDALEVEREKLAILRVLSSFDRPVGSKIISRRLKSEFGIGLSERAIRYHLKLMDEQGLTSKVSGRAGRIITARGLEELNDAIVIDKIGFVIDRIEVLAFKTTFDPLQMEGMVPVNISLIPEKSLKAALKAMAPAFKAGLGVSEKVALASRGEVIGDTIVPRGYFGLATVCSIVVNGSLLKTGVPMDSRFGGLLQIREHKPWRFTDLVEYAGSSLDPSEVFIAGRRTNITSVTKDGNGKILANFREVPAVCLPLVDEVIERLSRAGVKGVVLIGEPGESVCGIPVSPNKAGIILYGGLNPVAMAVEAGIEVKSKAMSSVLDFKELKSFWDIV